VFHAFVPQLNSCANKAAIIYLNLSNSLGDLSRPRLRPTTVRARSQVVTPWKCYFCGGNKQHKRDSCPARESTCNKCSQIGHWSKACRKGQNTENSKSSQPSAKVNTVVNDSDYYFIGTINQENENTQWEEDIYVGGKPIKFRLDSGADVTIIKSAIWDNNLRHKGYKLVPADKKLIGPSGRLLECCNKANHI
jgi:hypothetical protein